MADDAPAPTRLRLVTFGGLSIQAASGGTLPAVATRRQSLALLAFIAAAGPSGVSRDRVCAVFWPESDTERARNALKQLTFSLRRDLKQPELITGTTEIRLNRDTIDSDFSEFVAAVTTKDFERASELYMGPFLEGVHLRNTPEFERWAESERSRVSDLADMSMRSAAKAAAARGDLDAALRWWRRIVALNPMDTAATLELMRTLAQRGDRAAAMHHARIHTALVREELGADVDPRVSDLVKSLSQAVAPRIQSPPNDNRRRVPSPPDIHGQSRALEPEPEVYAATPIPQVLLDAARERVIDGPPRRARPFRPIVAGAFILVTATVGWLVAHRKTAGAVNRASSALLIAPFHVDAPDSSLGFLREGMIDLLRSSFSGDSLSPRIVESPGVIALLSTSGAAGEPPSDKVIEAARRAGVAHIVTGNAVREKGDMLLNATMIDATTGNTVGTAAASGNVDSLPHLVDELAEQLIAIRVGEPSVSADLLSATPLAAVKEYLMGRVAFRDGAYEDAVRHQKLALLSDSTFALAAIELGRIAGWLGDDAARRWAYERAWANREKLRPLDRAVVVATLGPHYPKGSSRAEWLAAWEHVAELRPDEPGAWYEAGDLLFHNPWLGTSSDREGLARAKTFFVRALDRAPDYMPALQHLLQLAAHENDTALVRRTLLAVDKAHPSADLSTYLHWRAALALGDAEQLRYAKTRIQSGTLLPMQWEAMTSEEDGVALNDAGTALQVRMSKASTDQERVDAAQSLHALGLDRGRLDQVSSALRTLSSTRLGSDLARDIRVLDVLYGGVPLDPAAREAVAQLETSARATPPDPVASGEQWSVDQCILGHWYLAQRQNARVTAQTVRLKNIARRFSAELWSDGANTCAILLEASVAVREKSGSAPALLRKLEDKLSVGAYTTSRLVWDITAIASARLFEEAGDFAAAEQAARRRNWYYRWPHYLATQLFELGRIAETRGDGQTALEAYSHYLQLRSAPDSVFRLQADRVRASEGAIR